MIPAARHYLKIQNCVISLEWIKQIFLPIDLIKNLEVALLGAHCKISTLSLSLILSLASYLS